VTAFVGNKDGQGLQNGQGVDALFWLPSAVAVDSAGNVYVADTGNNAIRKITPGGDATLVAGGSLGTNEGAGSTAQFNSPSGITVDGAGTLYVADTGNNRIRKIAGGLTSLFIGAGAGGQSLSAPSSVACDRFGNLYIADTNNFRVLKVAAGQSTATVLAGSGSAGQANGGGSAAQFISPASLTVDFNGNVYVADVFSIRKIDPSGNVSTPSITGDATFFSQVRVTTDRQGDGSILYVTDAESDKIFILRRDATSGEYEAEELAGSTQGYAEGAGANAMFFDPLQPFVTDSGTIYVPDYGNNVIRRMN
jgi:sugar lactone lactonase YvrE